MIATPKPSLIYVSALSDITISQIEEIKAKNLLPHELERVKKEIEPFSLDEDYSDKKTIEKLPY